MILLVQADARQIPLPSKYVQTCITSPPYWGLRSYGLDDRGLGLEATPEEYVANLVAVFREVRRVLRDDGTVWCNLGDSYATGTAAGRRQTSTWGPAVPASWATRCQPERCGTPIGWKTKDLLGIPWRVAFALQADGWYLRSDIVWAKGYSFHPTTAGSCMPESVTDRPTRGHEYLFLLSKSATYYYDAEAVKEAAQYGRREWKPAKTTKVGKMGHSHYQCGDLTKQRGGTTTGGDPSQGRNLRSVWLINPKPYRGAHFATFPPALVEPCVKAGSPPDCCGACGTPYRRIVERRFVPQADVCEAKRHKASGVKGLDTSNTWGATPRGSNAHQTLGWSPACTCAAEPAASVVLDPFCGSGTVGLVAKPHGRIFVGLDLKMDYLRLAQVRNGLAVAASAPRTDDPADSAPAPCPEPIASEEAS